MMKAGVPFINPPVFYSKPETRNRLRLWNPKPETRNPRPPIRIGA
jgi:hypothetical protein